MQLSIVTTLYRSAEYVEEFHRRASASAAQISSDFEIVFVDDGSPDDSALAVRRLMARDPRVRLVRLSRNYGHFHAIMSGLAHSRGELVFLVDSDLEEPPEALLELLDRMRRGDGDDPIDVVYGIQPKRRGRLLERVTGALFYSIFNRLSEVKVPRNALIARLMTRRYVDALLRHRERELFILGVMTSVGFRQEPVLIEKVATAPTTYTFWKKVSLTLKSMSAFSDKPLGAIFMLGLAISLLALVGMLYLVVSVVVFDMHYLVGWTSLALLISFFGGMSLVSIGAVGFYLGRVFVEVKARPVIVMDVEEAPAEALEAPELTGSGTVSRDGD